MATGFYSPGMPAMRIPARGEYLSVEGEPMLVTGVDFDGSGGVQITIERPKPGDPNLAECGSCGSYRAQCPQPQARCCRGCSHEPNQVVDQRVWPQADSPSGRT